MLTNELTIQLKTARGTRYYDILKTIRKLHGPAIACTFIALRRTYGKMSPAMLGWLALRYDMNLKALCWLLNDMRLLPLGVYEKMTRYWSVTEILARGKWAFEVRYYDIE